MSRVRPGVVAGPLSRSLARDTIILMNLTGNPGDRQMTAENFDQVLIALRASQPFRVFTVELNGGSRFEVDHPGALVVRDGVAVFLAPGGVPVWFDHDSVDQIVGAPASTSVG